MYCRFMSMNSEEIYIPLLLIFILFYYIFMTIYLLILSVSIYVLSINIENTNQYNFQ